jgi:hypothetical protein
MRCRGFAASLIFVIGPLQQAGAETVAPSESVTVTGHALRDNPDGKGDPDDIVCRKPQQLPASRLMAPPVCKSNREWAQIRQDGNDVSPDGRQIVQSEKARSLNPLACLSPRPPAAKDMNTSDLNSYCY